MEHRVSRELDLVLRNLKAAERTLHSGDAPEGESVATKHSLQDALESFDAARNHLRTARDPRRR